jgi:hypothetical protein
LFHSTTKLPLSIERFSHGANPHNGSNLQIASRKNGSVWQKNRGPAENIYHFFSRFFGFLGFLALQAIESKGQAAIKTLQKKSYLKTYGRFFVFPGLWQNQRHDSL